MKKTDFRKAYLSFVRLYGAIYSDHAYQILKGYFPDLKKSVFNKDLKSRHLKQTRGYNILTCGHQHYVIAKEFFASEDIDETFNQQGEKPFFVPSTFEEFIQYGDATYPLLANPKYREDLQSFIKQHLIFEQSEDEDNPLDKDKCAELAARCLAYQMEFDDNIEHIIKLVEALEIDLSDDKTMREFLEIIQNIVNNTRNIYNCGFTPTEMIAMNGPIDFNDIKMTMGKNMKEMFLKGEIDPFEYLESLEKSDLPKAIKESLKQEINEIIKEIKVGQA